MTAAAEPVAPIGRARGVARRALRSAMAFVPTRRLALAVALVSPLWLVSGTSVGFWLAVIALFAVIVAAIADVLMLPSARHVDVERRMPSTIGVGDESEARYELHSRWPRPLVVSVYDALPARHLERLLDAGTAQLPPNGDARLDIAVRGAARGESALGPVALRVRTTLGLVQRTLRYELDDRILVAPSIAGVTRFRWLAVHHRLMSVGVRSTRRRGEGRSFARLRDYVPGDDPRHIDWKATARRGHPITREFTVEQSQTVFVLVDAGRSMTQLAGAYPRFEYALSASLLLADVALTAGDRVGAMVFDDELRALVPAQRGATALRALRTALVPVQPTLVEPDYATAFRALAQRQRKRALIVLITDVLDARAARLLLAQLTRGASRHLALVVALRNEALLAATKPSGSGERELYVSAAAEELVAERLTAIQRMRDAGVIVLDITPDAMAAAVVNQYLELKARGSL